MKIWLFPTALVGLICQAGAARADQCAWVNEAVAARAASVLGDHPTTIDFCEPCGDVVPGVPRKAREVGVREVGDGRFQVELDGKGVDLAYVYVERAEGNYRNLALLAACEATGVSPALSVHTATDRGVLIQADAALPARAPFPAAPAMLAPAPPAPPAVVYLLPAPLSTSAAAAYCALGALFTASLFGGAWVVALAFRRRRPLLPRAIRLADRHPPPDVPVR